MEDLRKQLEEERKKKKELASANVKLNGMLKIGQDAIKAEQDAVKQLQEQLDTISSHGSQVEKTKKNHQFFWYTSWGETWLSSEMAVKNIRSYILFLFSLSLLCE